MNIDNIAHSWSGTHTHSVRCVRCV